MFSIKNKIIAIAILTVLTSVYFYLKQFTIVKVKVIESYENTQKKDSISIATLSQELEKKDSLYFDCLQTLNVNFDIEKQRQIVIQSLTKSFKTCQNDFDNAIASGGIKIVHDSIFVEKVNSGFFRKVKYKIIDNPKTLIK